MRLTSAHIKYYKQNKFNVNCPLFKAFDKKEKFSIHKLINDQSDIVSLIRHNRNRPLDKDYKISNLYNLIRLINSRVSGTELISNLKQLSYAGNKRKSIINKIIKRLES